MQSKIDDISKIIKEQIKNYSAKVEQDEVGYVISVGDGISKVHGLDKCKSNELLEFSKEGLQAAQNESADTPGSKASSRINVTDNSALGLPHASVRMACSKGTYVRAFARDLGEALGSGAHLDSLQRSRSGIFCVENALTVEQVIGILTRQ